MDMHLPLVKNRRTLLAIVLAFAVANSGQAGDSFSLRTESFSSEAHPAHSAELFSRNGLGALLEDGEYVLSSPFRWGVSEWELFGGSVALVGASSALDSTVRRQTFKRTPSATTKQFQKLGAEYSFVVLAGFEVVDLLADDHRARAVALDGISATLLASGIVTPALKYSFGRYRPTETTRTFKFNPLSSHASFPSGHVTQAFAVATVIASHYEAWWIQTLSYGAAAGVGYSRVDQRAHFVSDVLAGGLIGFSVARAVVHHNGALDLAGFTVSPMTGRSFTGVLASKLF